MARTASGKQPKLDLKKKENERARLEKAPGIGVDVGNVLQVRSEHLFFVAETGVAKANSTRPSAFRLDLRQGDLLA